MDDDGVNVSVGRVSVYIPHNEFMQNCGNDDFAIISVIILTNTHDSRLRLLEPLQSIVIGHLYWSKGFLGAKNERLTTIWAREPYLDF